MTLNRLHNRVRAHSDLIAPVVVVAIGALLSLILGESQLLDISLWIVYALLTLSLFFVWGHGGMLSLAQTAFFGVAGYAYGAIAINSVGITGETITAVVAAVVIASAFAAMLGYFMFYGRISELYLSITTLVVTLILYTFFASTADPRYAIGSARLGGYNGMTGIPSITLAVPGLFELSLDIRALYVFVVLIFGLVFIGLKILLRASFGRVLAAVRENEMRCELLGYDVRLIKLQAFVLGGAIAALAGVMYAAWGRFINPAPFSIGQAVAVVIWLLVGGRSFIWGSLIGVIVVQGVLKILGGFTQHSPIFLGVILVLTVMLFRSGMAGYLWGLLSRFEKRSSVAESWLAKLQPVPSLPFSDDQKNSSYSLEGDRGMKAPVVDVQNLSISFGGVQALLDVTLMFKPGLCCLIGPNGAGKSTLFNLLIGRFPPAKGTILYNGKDIKHFKIHERIRQGIGIKMQIPSIFSHLSVEENVWVAAYAYIHDTHQATAMVWKVLQQVGLTSDRFKELAGNLSHGEQQLLELAIVLVSNAKFILLDEPAAGLMRREKTIMAQLISEIARSATVVVVEHDMEFVRKLGAPVSVLHQGQVFTQGSLEEVRQDERVIDVYLGRNRHAAG